MFNPQALALATKGSRPANMGLLSAWHRLGHQTSQPLPLVVRICQDDNAMGLSRFYNLCQDRRF